MKGKNPTRVQKVIIQNRNLNPSNWLVLKNMTNELVIKHRFSGRIRTLSL